MPKNLHFDIRKQVLNELFRGKGYTINELVQRVGEKISEYRKDSKGVSKKTIQNDIRFIKEEARKKNADLVCKNSKYRYEPPDFNIYDIQITPNSVEKIKLAISILKQIKGLDVHEELKEVYDKLNMRVTDDFESERRYIQFDVRQDYTGSEYLAELLEAIKGETVISFDYQPFMVLEKYHVIVHPYLLKEYNNRWFLIGWQEEKKLIQVYGLDRIKSKIKHQGKIIFFDYHKFNSDTYYNDVIGVSIPPEAKVESVVLKFKRERVKYVETNPLHHSQKLKTENVTSKTYTYQLIPNNELKSLILYFGSDVEVMSPKKLRSDIAQILLESNRKYL